MTVHDRIEPALAGDRGGNTTVDRFRKNSSWGERSVATVHGVIVKPRVWRVKLFITVAAQDFARLLGLAESEDSCLRFS